MFKFIGKMFGADVKAPIVAEKTEKNEFQSIPIINYKKNGEELVQIVLEALSLKQ